MRRNRLRELLNEGKPTLGTHVIVPWPGIVEVIGSTGVFDYIEYVGEYSPWSLELLDNFARAIDLFPDLSSMMKVEEQLKGFIATKAIDAGIQNVLFADLHTADEVRECIRLVRPETPESGGTHGCNMRRITGYTLNSSLEEWIKAMNDTVIAIMIEKKVAMENLENILSVEGVDMVQFGPADYSITIGKPGQRSSPEVRKAERDMIEMALDKGVHPRVEIRSFEQAEPYIEMGVRHFCIGWDLRVIYDWCQQQAEGMRQMPAFARLRCLEEK